VRPSHLLFLLLTALLFIDGGLYLYRENSLARQTAAEQMQIIVTAGLGLTDLCVATEARYTRHPAISDRAVIRMDHPGAIDHFPTGSFWAPPEH
jgi:hypothetical protein